MLGEFCSVIFVFFMALQTAWIHFEFTHMRLSAVRKLIFGVHGVQ